MHISGYADEDLDELPDDVMLLRKPFTAQQLRHAMGDRLAAVIRLRPQWGGHSAARSIRSHFGQAHAHTSGTIPSSDTWHSDHSAIP